MLNVEGELTLIQSSRIPIQLVCRQGCDNVVSSGQCIDNPRHCFISMGIVGWDDMDLNTSTLHAFTWRK